MQRSKGWLPQEAIRIKRDGGALDSDDLQQFVAGIVDGSICDAQVAAFAMAVHFRGMLPAECAALTLAMRDSGEIFDWSRDHAPGPVLDKHSTGGVGDLVSLVLGPMLAACGAWVPMIAGRGLAHTGGTLDKLESIPGYQSQPAPERIREALKDAGVAIVGASDRIAPADRRLYAIRDVTATVDCIPLIVTSILSKKLAGGLDALVLDVKTGCGAVLADPARGRELARAIVSTAAEAGLPVAALLTDMSEPLARSAGNALELREAIGILQGGDCDARLLEVTLSLGAEVMVLGGLAAKAEEARTALRQSLANGAAAERFARMAASLGGPRDLLERPDAHLVNASIVRDVPSVRDGHVTTIDTRALGFAVVALGGGRTAPDQAIDHAVGLDRLVPRGARVRRGEPIARVHAASDDAAARAVEAVVRAFAFGDAPPTLPRLVERLA
jgi:thymidine phosphorylase